MYRYWTKGFTHKCESSNPITKNEREIMDKWAEASAYSQLVIEGRDLSIKYLRKRLAEVFTKRTETELKVLALKRNLRQCYVLSTLAVLAALASCVAACIIAKQAGLWP